MTESVPSYVKDGVEYFNVSAQASASSVAGSPTEEPAIEEKKDPKLKSGFAILVDEEGNVYVERNLTIYGVPVEREASLIEIRRYSSEILMDLQAQAAAEYAALRILPQGSLPQE